MKINLICWAVYTNNCMMFLNVTIRVYSPQFLILFTHFLVIRNLYRWSPNSMFAIAVQNCLLRFWCFPFKLLNRLKICLLKLLCGWFSRVYCKVLFLAEYFFCSNNFCNTNISMKVFFNLYKISLILIFFSVNECNVALFAWSIVIYL